MGDLLALLISVPSEVLGEAVEELARGSYKRRVVLPLAEQIEGIASSLARDIAELSRRGAVEICPWYTRIEPYEHIAEAILQNGIQGHRMCLEHGVACSDTVVIHTRLGLPPAMPRICRLLGIRALVVIDECSEESREFRWCVGSACIDVVLVPRTSKAEICVGSAPSVTGAGLAKLPLLEPVSRDEVATRAKEVLGNLKPLPKSGIKVLALETVPMCVERIVEMLEQSGAKYRIVSASALIDLVLGRVGTSIPKRRLSRICSSRELVSALSVEKVVSLHLGLTLSALSIEGGIEVGSEQIDRAWRSVLKGFSEDVAREIGLRVSKYLAMIARHRSGIAFVNPVPHQTPSLLEILAPRRAINGVLMVKWGELEPIDSPRGEIVRLGVIINTGRAGVGVIPVEKMSARSLSTSALGSSTVKSIDVELDGKSATIVVRARGRELGLESVEEYFGSSISWTKFVTAVDPRVEVLVRKYSSMISNAVDIEVRNGKRLELGIEVESVGDNPKILYYTPWLVEELKLGDRAEEVVFQDYMIVASSKEFIAIASRDLHVASISRTERGVSIVLKLSREHHSLRLLRARDLGKCIAAAISFARPPIGIYIDGYGRPSERFFPILSLEPWAELSSAKPWSLGKGVVTRVCSPIKSIELTMSLPNWVKEVCRATALEKPIECVDAVYVRKLNISMERGGVETLVLKP